jgi:spore maturation protein CgeB
MRILIAHGYNETYPDYNRLRRWMDRLCASGFGISDFYVGMNVRGMRLPFRDLDHRWNVQDRTLLEMYEKLARASEDHDVLINFGGVNLHPEFLRMLKTINVLRFSDDPESSDQVSRPIAPYHDICAISNIAEVETYRRWGVEHAYWVPMGFWHDEYDPSQTSVTIGAGVRDTDVTLLCERVNSYRRAAVDKYSLAFPQGVFRGPGWPDGFLPEDQRVPLLQRTKIGLNIHNSTGPINSRTYYLPANGILQICDNKRHLGQIYELGKEVVGYDSIEEAIELTRYYLAHDDERTGIAVAGFRRALAEYNEVTCFRRLVDIVSRYLARGAGRGTVQAPAVLLSRQRAGESVGARFAASIVYWPRLIASKFVRGGSRRASFLLASAKLRAMRAVKKC